MCKRTCNHYNQTNNKEDLLRRYVEGKICFKCLNGRELN